MDCRQNRTSFVTSRRALLLGGASFAAWAYLPKFARAADARDPRLIVVILRGALDGLATVAPLGDPDYATLHGSIALTPNGPHAATMLDSFFALHPAMPEGFAARKWVLESPPASCPIEWAQKPRVPAQRAMIR